MFILDINPQIFLLHAVCATALGACFGSFAGVIIYRLPKGLSIVFPRSHCVVCRKNLALWQNIPFFSWLILRGRCGFCKSAIGIRALLLELIMALGFLALYLKFGASFSFFERSFFLFLLICLAYIDLDTFFLPFSLLALLIALGLFSNLVYSLKPSLYVAPSPPHALLSLMVFNAPLRFSFTDRLFGALLGALVLVSINFIATMILRRSGRIEIHQWAMGFGDALLLFALGLFVGASHLLLLIFLASLTGSVVGIVARFDKNAHRDKEIAEGALPYGPFLAIAAIYVYLF